MVAPLRAADLSLHDNVEGVAGLALLDQQGAVFELLRFECLGEIHPLDEGHRAQARDRSLRQRPTPPSEAKKLIIYDVGLANDLRGLHAQFCKSLLTVSVLSTAPPEASFGSLQFSQNAELVAEQPMFRLQPVALRGMEPRGLCLR